MFRTKTRGYINLTSESITIHYLNAFIVHVRKPTLPHCFRKCTLFHRRIYILYAAILLAPQLGINLNSNNELLTTPICNLQFKNILPTAKTLNIFLLCTYRDTVNFCDFFHWVGTIFLFLTRVAVTDS